MSLFLLTHSPMPTVTGLYHEELPPLTRPGKNVIYWSLLSFHPVHGSKHSLLSRGVSTHEQAGASHMVHTGRKVVENQAEQRRFDLPRYQCQKLH